MRRDGLVVAIMKALTGDILTINHWNEEPDGLGKYYHSFAMIVGSANTIIALLIFLFVNIRKYL
jgi:hypothetical protein